MVDRNLLNKATDSSAGPTPGYLFKDISCEYWRGGLDRPLRKMYFNVLYIHTNML